MMADSQLLVIALGGNAITQAGESGVWEEQYNNIKIASEQIGKIQEKKYKLVITHGNGPQAGALLLQHELGSVDVPAQPLHCIGAMTQGQIGYMFQNALGNYFTKAQTPKAPKVPIASVLTQVVVDPLDPDFQNPSKPVGPFYTKEIALKYKEERGYEVKQVKPEEVEKNWRRVVGSPEPLELVEKASIQALLDAGAICICSGGGGIPVARMPDGVLSGVDAVIDKDKAGNLLAQTMKADIYMILTDVEHALINYKKEGEEKVGVVTVGKARELMKGGHFLAGSMGPKMEAACRFVEGTGGKAIITSLSKAIDALEGKTGTQIIPN